MMTRWVLALALLFGSAAPPDSPVAEAARRGDVEGVRTLLRSGADVNAAQGDGMTALHWAAQSGNLELAEVLLYAGANVEAGTRIGGYTPLHIAAKEARAEVATALLGAGGDPTARTTNSGTTPLHLAAASGSVEIARLLVAAGAMVDATEDSWGQTPLVFAASNNRAEVIPLLIAAGADPNRSARRVDVEEWEEADRAAERRLDDFLKDLREREGAGPDWQPTPSQVQAAIEAAREIQRKWPDVPKPEDDREGRAANAEGEAGGAKVDAPVPDSVGADEAQPNQGVEPLSEVELPPEAEVDGAVETPEVTEAGDSATAKEEEEEEEEPRPKSYAQLVGSWGGLTPLAHAVRQGHREATLALLDGGADINQPFGGDETSPILMATLNGQFDLAMLLLERGADPLPASTAGTTPLYATLERQWAPRSSYAHPTAHQQQTATHLDLMRALLEAGADPNARLTSHLWFMEYTFGVLRGSGIHLEGATPFWRAAYALDVDAMRLLLDHGADPSIATVRPPERRRRPMEEADEEEPKTEGNDAVKPDSANAAEADAGLEAGAQAVPESGSAEESAAKADAQYGPDNPTKGNAEGESSGEAGGESGGTAEVEDEEEIDHSGIPPVPVGGPNILPIHAASGVGYGQSFAGNAHQHVPDNWLAAVRFLVEEAGADVNARDANALTPLHHAASRGDTELISYLVEQGADPTVLSRKGQTTADMANGPVQRVPPYPEAIELLVRLGAKNNGKCVSC